jgi:hypothetical protein
MRSTSWSSRYETTALIVIVLAALQLAFVFVPVLAILLSLGVLLVVAAYSFTSGSSDDSKSARQPRFLVIGLSLLTVAAMVLLGGTGLIWVDQLFWRHPLFPPDSDYQGAVAVFNEYAQKTTALDERLAAESKRNDEDRVKATNSKDRAELEKIWDTRLPRPPFGLGRELEEVRRSALIALDAERNLIRYKSRVEHKALIEECGEILKGRATEEQRRQINQQAWVVSVVSSLLVLLAATAAAGLGLRTLRRFKLMGVVHDAEGEPASHATGEEGPRESEPLREARAAADPIACLQCGRQIPVEASACPACGWSYQGGDSATP